jgi:hypothetical protein
MNILVIILLIYFTGYVIAFLICRDYRRFWKHNKWENIIESFGYASFSWVFLFIYVLYEVYNINLFDKDPPKWL